MFLPLLIASLVGSAGMAYVAGLAFVSPRQSFLRSKRGIWVVVVGTLSLVPLPPQVLSLGSASVPAGMSLPGVTDMLAAPHGLSGGLVVAVWLLTTIGAALAGARVWDAGKPGWRPGATSAYDTSSAGRARGLLLLADTLEDGAGILARVGVDSKAAERLAPDLRELGRRLEFKLPAESSAVYRAVVAEGVPAGVASVVTRHLLEGARRTD